MKIALSAESTIDMPKELLNKFFISTVPFTILLKEETKLDGEMSIDEIFDFVNKTKQLPKTSNVNNFQYEEHFKKLLKTNDAIIHLSLSGEFSSAYQNAQKVAQDFENVFVIDTRSLSTGIALLAIYASGLIKQGFDAKEIVNKVKARISSVQASFILQRLDYLYKGGRCSSLQLFGANLLKLRPQIVVCQGKMKSGKKFRGKYEQSVLDYVNYTLEEFNTPDLEQVFITYTTAPTELVESIRSILVNRGFKNIYITRAGATISSHCGENCLGILYINDGGNNA